MTWPRIGDPAYIVNTAGPVPRVVGRETVIDVTGRIFTTENATRIRHRWNRDNHNPHDAGYNDVYALAPNDPLAVKAVDIARVRAVTNILASLIEAERFERRLAGQDAAVALGRAAEIRDAAAAVVDRLSNRLADKYVADLAGGGPR
jgi:hypothetical protein